MRAPLPLRRCIVPLLLAAALTAPASASDTPELLLEVRLEQHLVSDGVHAFQAGDEVLLPLGEIARLLTIAIRSDPGQGQASGFILDQNRPFLLDLHALVVAYGDRRERIDPAMVRALVDDIYVSSRLLEKWLPVNFALDMATLTLQVRARERLPLQARLERQGKGPGSMRAASADPGYPRMATPYRMARMPFADQTVGLDLRRNRAEHAHNASYTAYLTGDLLGAEAALYLHMGQYARGPAARLTLGRHDPDGALLGPLRARTVQVGGVPGAAVTGIALGNATGNGVLVSNRALGMPTHAERHKLQGDLAPGWDVELFFNDALVGFQQSRPDGRYSFEDQPLVYGVNQFRLVFHGPLGQVRVERHTFLLEQSMLAPGQFDYSVSVQRDDEGRTRSAALFDWGLGKRLSASAALVRLPLHGQLRSYASAGLQTYLDKLIVSATAARSADGGRLAQLGVKTRVGAMSLAGSRAVARGFVSDFYLPSGDPVRLRDELRADGVLAAMPVALHLRRDTLASGLHNLELAARVAAYWRGTAGSHVLRWQSLAGARHAEGQLQASRRLAGIGIGGQLQYTIRPHTALSTLALSADKHLPGGYLLGGAVTRTFADRDTRFAASLAKGLGRFGLGVNGWYTRRGAYGAGLQLFMALGRDPRSARWVTDAAPMAATGSASARVFLDQNRNGVMDGADTPIAGAGFVVNGATQLGRTGSDGVAWLARLTPNQHADIALDTATLEDPQWHSVIQGVRMVPRAGTVGELEFAVAVTGEIDGTVWVQEQGGKHAAGVLEIELADAAHTVVARASSGADGYYVLSGVAPGTYQLRIAPAQLARLGLRAPPPRQLVVDEDASFVSGQDMLLVRE